MMNRTLATTSDDEQALQVIAHETGLVFDATEANLNDLAEALCDTIGGVRLLLDRMVRLRMLSMERGVGLIRYRVRGPYLWLTGEAPAARPPATTDVVFQRHGVKLDYARRQILCGQRAAHLQPHRMRVLETLLRSAPGAVRDSALSITAQSSFAAAPPDNGANVLSVCIHHIRRALRAAQAPIAIVRWDHPKGYAARTTAADAALAPQQSKRQSECV